MENRQQAAKQEASKNETCKSCRNHVSTVSKLNAQGICRECVNDPNSQYNDR